jgi:hypothetical protein
MLKARLSLLHASAVLLIFTGLSCDNRSPQETDGPFPAEHLEPVSVKATNFDNFTESKPHTIVVDHTERENGTSLILTTYGGDGSILACRH